LRGFGTRTADVNQIKIPGFDEFAETPGCSSSEFSFGLASGVVDLRGVESDQADVGMLTINLDRIAVDDPDIARVDPFCVGWYGNEQQCEKRNVNFHSRQP
jgi:hypothetical protein